MHKAKSSGIAIISVLMIVAVVALLAANITSNRARFQYSVGNILNYQKALLLLLSVESWATNLLVEDANETATDSLEDMWANQLPDSVVDANVLSGVIIDEQGRINLNNLYHKDNIAVRAQINRLFRQLELPTNIIDALIDYIDNDNVSQSSSGAENDFYSRLDPPYHIANQPLADLSELMLIKGFNAEIINKLKPFVWVGPIDENNIMPINVNTSSPEVLRTLADGLDGQRIDNVLTERSRQAFASIDAFIAKINNNKIDRNLLSIKSNYFLLVGQVSNADSTFYIESHLYRPDGPKPKVQITRRTLP